MLPSKILLIEDSPTDAELISRQLRKAGCADLTILEDKEEVKQELNNSYDLIISDYNLAGFKGIEVLAWARNRDPQVAFVICSGAVGDEKAAEVIKSGADDFISKDNLANRLLISIEKAFEASRLRKAESEARRELFLASERLQTIVNNIQESTLLITSSSEGDYRINQASPQFIKLLAAFNPKISRLQLGQEVNLFSFLKRAINPSEQLLNKISYGLEKTFSQNSNSTFQENVILDNGNRIILSFSSVPLKSEDDNVSQALIMVRDITSQVETDEYILTSTLEAQEKERRRLSYELHDSIGQSLSAAVLTLNKVLNTETNLTNDGRDKLGQALHYTNTAIQEARAIAHNLLPKSVEEAGLEDALDTMLNTVSDVSNISFSFNSNLKGRRLASDKEINLFRICQEAVNNIIRHSHATQGAIQIMSYEEVLILTIDDNGVGFDPKIKKQKSGIGVGGILSRVKAMGGEIEIDSKLNRGTNILIEIPINPN